MTPARFDAPASNTPARHRSRLCLACCAALSRHLAQRAWLISYIVTGKTDVFPVLPPVPHLTAGILARRPTHSQKLPHC
jgi:hypothetical protein